MGLITTDGCLSSDRRHTIFTSKDIELINIVKRVLGVQNRTGIVKNKTSSAYKIQIGSVSLFRWLESIGLHPAKSLTLGRIAVPDVYFRDFARGHLDGDGSITTFTDTSNTHKNSKYIYQRLYVRFISGSHEHLAWLHGKITQHFGVTGAYHCTKTYSHQKNPIYVIKFGKKESLKLLSSIYYSEDIPSLSRKRNVYYKFISDT